MRTPWHRAAVGGGFSLAVAVGVVFVLTATLPASAFVVRGGHSGGHIAMRAGGFHFKSGMAPEFRQHNMFFADHRGRFANQFFGALGFPYYGWYPFGGYPFGWNGGGYFPTVSSADAAAGDQGPSYVNGGIPTGGSPAPTGGYHGDCAVHELIYGDDGHYIGQKVVEACN
jgi:hypothetical protein